MLRWAFVYGGYMRCLKYQLQAPLHSAGTPLRTCMHRTLMTVLQTPTLHGIYTCTPHQPTQPYLHIHSLRLPAVRFSGVRRLLERQGSRLFAKVLCNWQETCPASPLSFPSPLPPAPTHTSNASSSWAAVKPGHATWVQKVRADNCPGPESGLSNSTQRWVWR